MPKIAFPNTYYKFWWGVITEFNLSPTEALFVGFIDGLSRKHGYCYASKLTIAKTLNISTQTVYNLQKSVISKGVLVQLEGRANKGIARIAPSLAWKQFVKSKELKNCSDGIIDGHLKNLNF